MRFYTSVSIFALSASVLSAPTPQAGSLTNIGSGNDNHNGNKVIGDNALLSGNVVALNGLTDGILKEKRQGTELEGVTGAIGDVTKIRVVGNARRQLGVPVVPGTAQTVDSVTGKLGAGSVVQGLESDIQKRQLGGDLSGVTDLAGLATKPVNTVANGINVFDDKKAKRDLTADGGIPVVNGLPVAGGLTDPLKHTPVVEGGLAVVNGVVPDTNGLDSSLFGLVKPVSDATSVLDVKREAGVVDTILAGEGSTNNIGSLNGNGNGNSIIGHNTILSGNDIVDKREPDVVDTILAGSGSKVRRS